MPTGALPRRRGAVFCLFCKIDIGDNKSMSEKTGENKSMNIGK